MVNQPISPQRGGVASDADSLGGATVEPYFINCVIANNIAASSGGGLYTINCQIR